MRHLLPLGLLLIALPATAADFPGPMKITVRTTDCDGATGMAQVNADAITRVQPYTCSNGRQLKQVLSRTASGVAEAFTISNDEAPKIEAALQQVQRTREKALEETKPVIIERR